MKEIIFATSNDYKLLMGQQVLTAHGIQLVKEHLDIDEIQGEDGERIARDKAQKAFNLIGKPLIVNDDWWEIPGAGGFPGPYMKSVNQWFKVKNWLDLTRPLTDRRAILRQYLVYQDAAIQKVFVKDAEGELLSEARGRTGESNHFVITFDGKHSMAEMMERGESILSERENAWQELGPWLAERLGSTATISSQQG